MVAASEIQIWIAALGDKDGQVREQNRLKLERIGKTATPFLIKAMKDPSPHVRWEAAKALKSIADPDAAPVLVATLMDESIEVGWLAAEALLSLGRPAVLPLLNALVDHFDSVRLRQGAHHVLHTMERKHQLDSTIQPVLDALRSIEPEVTVPWAAERALEALMHKS